MADRRTVTVAVLVFVAVATAPIPGLASPGQYALATAAFAGVLWVTGGLPLPITALTIPVLLAGFGVVPNVGEAVAGFADPIIFLLLAGFVLAEALQKHGTDRRVAYHVLAAVGTSPRRIVFAVMVATAALSMVISNSATTAMMVPIALGIADRVIADDAGTNGGTERDAVSENPPAVEQTIPRDESARLTEQPNFRLAMLLGVAYAASIGGVGTLIGTPPNAIVVSQLSEQLGYTITFVDWLAIGLPFVVVGLPVTWYVLAVLVYPPQVDDASVAREEARRYLRRTGPPSAAEQRVLLITGATASLWLLGGLGFLFEGVLPPRLYVTLFGGSGDHLFGVGDHQGILYFVTVGLAAIPALAIAGTIDWDDIQRIDWGTIILLAGGISLANALATTDATRWLAESVVGSMAGAPILVVALIVAAAMVAASEIASNTAMAAISVPILISMGPRYAGAFGTSPTAASVFLAITGAIAASFGFALPVATPPNAIAFGTGQMTKDHMLRPGVILDVAMVLVTAVLAFGLFTLVWPVVT
ncbi:SLC13 family permease (plasmid) [Halorussus limi]|uniref:SLC13 family permease n=1 Tax=Halorussus limi TaxID=2938695 RepID=A0A8U0I1M3_9EURY|nr:SLC13 family permease [Halorussus limi]UPV76933.1 SLC13 family permease [Halorussus limi]